MLLFAPHRYRGLCLVVLIGLFAAGCSAQEDSGSVVAEGAYGYAKASRDGTGKFYMEREIAQVMGHRGAPWLERANRQREERTDLLIERLPLDADADVADIGAGTGYFAFPVAARVPQGRVYAVDIQPEMLAILKDRMAALKVSNVTPVQGSIESPGLAPASIDLAFIVDAYHEFSHPREMGMALALALRPGGRLVLIEYRGEDPKVPIKRLHKMTKRQVRREMEALGLVWESTQDFLPQQHVLTFRKAVF